MATIQRLLIANRGEIACRIIRTCRRLGIETVAVYSEADADEPHVRAADRAVLIGPPAVADSYLRIDTIVAAAVRTGCDAVHPGYGFLAERAAFAQAVVDAGLTFVGPSPHAIALMGDKAAAKRHVRDIGVPLVPGTEDDRLTDDELVAASDAIGLPLLIKAVAGGGGKGMRAVSDRANLGEAIAAARREALSAFGDDRVLLERLVSRPRHVEVQVFGDEHGNVIHLLERECSVQRRHQKVVEECPSPALDEALRARMGAAAVAVAASVGYTGAGTVEFLVAGDTLASDQPEFYFLEMNTRLQVEHPVTEAVTGLDLVELQLGVAAGEVLPVHQEDVQRLGHAIEVRLYAEDPVAMLPQSGRIRSLTVPDLPGFRADLGVAVGSEVGRYYDPMLGKLIVHAEDRIAACDLMGAVLRDTAVLGVVTNLELLKAVVADEVFRSGDLSTAFLEERLPDLRIAPASDHATVAALLALEAVSATTFPGGAGGVWASVGPYRAGTSGGWAGQLDDGTGASGFVVRSDRSDRVVTLAGRSLFVAAIGWDEPSRLVAFTLDGVRCSATVDIDSAAVPSPVVWVHTEGVTSRIRLELVPRSGSSAGILGRSAFSSPMPGAVIVVDVAVGQSVRAGQTLMVLEAMKMEHPIAAPVDGVVTAVHFAVGATIEAGVVLLDFEPAEPEEARHPGGA
jgi:acetyl/propionyl-CoA carboxylase alpha subunit